MPGDVVDDPLFGQQEAAGGAGDGAARAGDEVTDGSAHASPVGGAGANGLRDEPTQAIGDTFGGAQVTGLRPQAETGQMPVHLTDEDVGLLVSDGHAAHTSLADPDGKKLTDSVQYSK